MSNSRFITYTFFVSMLWGSLLVMSILEFENTLPLGLFCFAFMFVEMLSNSKEEREINRKKLQEPITKANAIKILFVILCTIVSIFIYVKFGESIAKLFPENSFIVITSALVGAFWAMSIQKAWHKHRMLKQ